jgi:hypothetical protein
MTTQILSTPQTSNPRATSSFDVRPLFLVSIVVAAAAHVPVIAPHLAEAPYMGYLFIALTAACLAIGAAVVLSERPAAYGAAVAVCGAAVIGYAATRLVAFPMLADDVGNWFEPLGVVSVLSESLVVVLGLIALRRRVSTRR